MITASSQLDKELFERFTSLTEYDKDYWSFKGNSSREHGHGYFQYPAMMVPQMVRAVLDEVTSVHSGIDRVYDPFSGSGTILTESMLKGLSFVGSDINPLAVLLCRTKSGPFFPAALYEKSQLLQKRINRSWGSKVGIDFPGIDKWFRSDVQISLSRIHRSIKREPAIWARRFFWIVLAEVVRITSNSRTSTFKLHVRPEQDVINRKIDPVFLFGKVLQRNLESYNQQALLLKEKNYLRNGHYISETEITLSDSRDMNVLSRNLADLLITSPPYGDNASTVPYGQYSYLPLQWIDMNDIDENASSSYLNTTQEIDVRSLGGSLKIHEETVEALSLKSFTYRKTIDRLASEPPDRAKRVTAFFRDLHDCLTPVAEKLRPGGVMVWTLGNRSVAGEPVLLDHVLQEFLEYEGAIPLAKLKRKITSKRMAHKNNIAKTMSDETILVMRKAG